MEDQEVEEVPLTSGPARSILPKVRARARPTRRIRKRHRTRPRTFTANCRNRRATPARRSVATWTVRRLGRAKSRREGQGKARLCGRARMAHLRSRRLHQTRHSLLLSMPPRRSQGWRERPRTPRRAEARKNSSLRGRTIRRSLPGKDRHLVVISRGSARLSP